MSYIINNQDLYSYTLANAANKLLGDLRKVSWGLALYDRERNAIVWPDQDGYHRPESDPERGDWGAWVSACVGDVECGSMNAHVRFGVSDPNERYGREVRVSVNIWCCGSSYGCIEVAIRENEGDCGWSHECAPRIVVPISEETCDGLYQAYDCTLCRKEAERVADVLCGDLRAVDERRALYDSDRNIVTWPGQFGYRKPFSDDSETDWAAWLSSCVLDSRERDGLISLTVSDGCGRYGYADVRISVPTDRDEPGTVSVKVTTGDGLASGECRRKLEKSISDEILRAYWDADEGEEED